MTAASGASPWTLESAIAEITRLRAEAASAEARGALRERERIAVLMEYGAREEEKSLHYMQMYTLRAVAAHLRAEPQPAAAASPWRAGVKWDGVPPNSEVEGWHWLRRGSQLWPWLWTDEDGEPGEFCWATDDDGDPETMAKQFQYYAPCVPPDPLASLPPAPEGGG